ncbi:putative lipid-binding transport protein (Tim44 family) [Azomonas agilis]|uniref:Putative lipid-binding transport protein (Tim44 family) n=1 Tax=Azomonas agilis TaxID=116849 RepID=A0A562J340_9GAMM|nr:TIM44-like domain-containing protein [Azomonas agilis]TWH77550.1 putative lipid-binding transport protein (Tim44 family) [Azomonas agilis]
MQRILSLFMAFSIALTLSFDASAKRMGGGNSLGSAPSHQSRDASPSTPAPVANPQARPQQQPAASGASRWLGPLAGLAAGGLLAALFMGGGFEGIQFLDILLLALIAFGIFYFIRKRRQQQQPAMAGHPSSMNREIPSAQANQGGLFNSATAQPAPIKAPVWFNEQSFIEAAREHFTSLQRYWNVNDMDSIADFVTPNMLALLKQERERLGSAHQTTQIENLHIQLDGVDDLADKTVATLTFSGLSKEHQFDQGERFSESWRMERLQGNNQPWLIAGIRQNI